jgi:hypothetical protein
MTAEDKVGNWPSARADYNQEAWGRAYSVRPRPLATVLTPMTWAEAQAGVRIEDFRLDNVCERFAKVGGTGEAAAAEARAGGPGVCRVGAVAFRFGASPAEKERDAPCGQGAKAVSTWPHGNLPGGICPFAPSFHF